MCGSGTRRSAACTSTSSTPTSRATSPRIAPPRTASMAATARRAPSTTPRSAWVAARGSRFQNGVSRIHGDVSALILADLWPEVPEQENPVLYVTNGVHVPTFLAPEWADAFDKFVGSGWQRRMEDPNALAAVMDMP